MNAPHQLSAQPERQREMAASWTIPWHDDPFTGLRFTGKAAIHARSYVTQVRSKNTNDLKIVFDSFWISWNMRNDEKHNTIDMQLAFQLANKKVANNWGQAFSGSLDPYDPWILQLKILINPEPKFFIQGTIGRPKWDPQASRNCRSFIGSSSFDELRKLVLTLLAGRGCETGETHPCQHRGSETNLHLHGLEMSSQAPSSCWKRSGRAWQGTTTGKNARETPPKGEDRRPIARNDVYCVNVFPCIHVFPSIISDIVFNGSVSFFYFFHRATPNQIYIVSFL